MSATFPPRLDPAERVSDAELSGALAALQAAVLAGVAEASVKPGELKAFKVGSVPAGWTQTSGPATGANGSIPYSLVKLLSDSPAKNVRFATAGGVLYALHFNSAATYKFEKFDDALGEWVPLAVPNTGVRPHTAVPMGPLIALPSGKLLYASVSAGSAVNAARLFDPAFGTWGPAANMPASCRGGGGFLLQDGTAYVSGDAASAYAYNETTNSWAAKAKNPLQNAFDAFHPLVSLGNGTALAASGTSYHVYDEATDSWGTAQPIQGGFSVGYNSPLFRVGGTVYSPGEGSFNSDKLLLSYDIASSTWGATGEQCIGCTSYGTDAAQFSDGSFGWTVESATRRIARRSTTALPTAIVWAVKD